MRSRLAWKIGGWLALVFALVAYTGWHILRDLNYLHQKALRVEAVNHESHHLHKLEMDLLHTATPVRSFLINGDWRQRNIFETNRTAMLSLLNQKAFGRPTRLQLTQALDDVTSRARRIFSLPFASGNLEGPILMREIDDALDKASNNLTARHHKLDQRVNEAMRMLSDMRMDIRNDFLLSIFALFLLLAGLAAYLYLHMIHPLVHLRRELKKISDGDFNIHCPELPRDELGELALACNTMGKALQDREVKLIMPAIWPPIMKRCRLWDSWLRALHMKWAIRWQAHRFPSKRLCANCFGANRRTPSNVSARRWMNCRARKRLFATSSITANPAPNPI